MFRDVNAWPSGEPARFRVLFCGETFPWGFEFTRQALESDADFEVRSACVVRVEVWVKRPYPQAVNMDLHVSAKAHNSGILCASGHIQAHTMVCYEEQEARDS